SIGTDLDSSLRTDLDSSIGTDLDSSLRTDLDSSIGTDLDSSLRTYLDCSFGTDLVSSLRTDLDQFCWNRSSQFFENRSSRLLGIRSSQFLSSRSSMTLRTMETMIEQQVALDEALVPSTKRLRIGKSNFRLPSDIQSKESTLQVFYNVLRSCPFFKAFLVTADVPEIYMQEFWATVYVQQHSIRFKLNKKAHQILEFLRFLRHSAQIRTLTDVNINKLFQPWRSFGAVINKCLTRKSSDFDSFRLSQAQILWGLYHSRNIDYAFLIWEDFVYQVEHKNQKKSNEMYDPRFTKVVSRHQNTQQYGAILPSELTNEYIRSTKAYKEYYAYASGEAALKPKDSARRKRGGFDSSTTPPTAIASSRPTTGAVTPRITAAAKGKQPAKANNEGTGSKPGVPDVPSDDSKKEISWNSSEDEETDTQEQDRHDDEGDEKDDSDDEETREEESFDPIPRTPEDSEDDGNRKEDQGLRISEEERIHEEEEADELYRDVDINQGKGLQVSHDIKDSHMTLTLVHPNGQQESSSVSSFVTSKLNPISNAGVESIFATASSSVAPLPTPIPTMTPFIITTITTASHPPIPPIQIPNKQIRLLKLSLTFRRIIKEQVKSQVKEQVSQILPRIEESVNAQLEVEVLTRSSHSSRTSYAVVADLSEMELKKILIEKMEGNKFIQRSDEQRNLYKALVDAYEADKTILDSYGETAILKRRREDDADQEGPFAGSDQGSKRRREGGEPESACAPLEPVTRSTDRSTTGAKSRQASASEYAFAKEPVQTTSQVEEPSHSVFETGAEDQPIVQTSQHPEWFPQPKKPPTLDRDWNKTLPATQGSTQLWISDL
nr:hypothetical protein [Tanacetum cinerariifolium]